MHSEMCFAIGKYFLFDFNILNRTGNFAHNTSSWTRDYEQWLDKRKKITFCQNNPVSIKIGKIIYTTKRSFLKQQDYKLQ